VNIENFITITEVEGQKADLIKSILESHGITVFTENVNTSNMLPYLDIPVKIQIPKEQSERAINILQQNPLTDKNTLNIK